MLIVLLAECTMAQWCGGLIVLVIIYTLFSTNFALFLFTPLSSKQKYGEKIIGQDLHTGGGWMHLVHLRAIIRLTNRVRFAIVG